MKKIEKQKALELRSNGLSVNKIAEIVGVAESTVSLWVRSVKLTEEQKQILKENSSKTIYNICYNPSENKSEKRLQMGEEAWNEYQSQRKEKDQKSWRAENADWFVNKRRIVKQQLINDKGGKCEICGYDKCISALAFHHKDRALKSMTISGSSRSYANLKEEADKCQLLCHNCHSELHEKEYVKQRLARTANYKNIDKP